MDALSPHDEKDLLQKMRDGDEHAFEILYHRYKGLLYAHAFKKVGDRDEVMDIVHDVFAGLWERRDALSITNLSAYLYNAVRYKIIDRLSKSQSAATYMHSLSAFAAAYVANADHLVRERMLRELIAKEIASLPPRMREVFELSRNEGLSHKEIAGQLNLSEQSVRSHIKNALKILRLRIGYFLLFTTFLN